jgi:hypothetical protein
MHVISDQFMQCWGAGNTTLFLLAKDNSVNQTSLDAGTSIRNKLYGLPFAKSAVVLMHSPVRTAFCSCVLQSMYVTNRVCLAGQYQKGPAADG